MSTPILALVLLLAQAGGALPRLEVGAAIEASIEDGDPRVETEVLRTTHPDWPNVGKCYRIEVVEAGEYTLELRSYYFDAYLVLRDDADELLDEDDNGLVFSHSRLVRRLEPGRSYRAHACAVEGGRGPFALALASGRPDPLDPRGRASADLAEGHKAIEEIERREGPASKPLADVIVRVALLLYEQGDLREATALLERALLIQQEVLGPEHADTLSTVNTLGVLYWNRGELATARTMYERAFEARERLLGPDHPRTATAANNLGLLLTQQGEWLAARPLLERALAVKEAELGPEHPDTTVLVMNLGYLLLQLGDWSAARPLYERALIAREKVLGPEHPDTAVALNNLADVLSRQGELVAARPLLERAIAITESTRGVEDPRLGPPLANLALLLQKQGDPGAARPLLERALAIQEKAYGPDSPNTAASLHGLGSVLGELGDLAGARELLERALAIREKSLGAENEATASALCSLGVVLEAAADHEGARQSYQRALAIQEMALGAQHPATVLSVSNLAVILWAEGRPAQAEPYFERVVAAFETCYGSSYPLTARAHFNLAMVLADQGREEEAWVHARSALQASLSAAAGTLWSLTESERMLLLGSGESNARLCLALGEQEHQAEAYELWLAWSGLVSRSLLESRAQLLARVSEHAHEVMARLRETQAAISRLLHQETSADVAEVQRGLGQLRDRRNGLERELERAAGPSSVQPVTLAQLADGLEAGSAWLDFHVGPRFQPATRPGKPGSWSEDHLVAWIVRHGQAHGQGLVQLDLGPAAPIEAALDGYLQVVVGRSAAARGVAAGSSEASSGAAGRELLAYLWQPLASRLEGIQRVFVRPDSFLGALPFEVLLLADGSYLLEERSFVYVQSPLDVLGALGPSGGYRSLLAVGGVDYAGRAEPPGDPRADAGAPGISRRRWAALPGTGDEVRTVSRLHARAFEDGQRVLLVGAEPSEERLKKELSEHSVLHLATHGFFNPERAVSLWDSARRSAEPVELLELEQEFHALVGQLPGLLCGVVCAGANEPTVRGRDDGLLTAEEVLWLDLSRVELVVLSACQTALGERRAGEGMIGLRRAFGLAGARTVISSLWSVEDQATARLMQGFYENLWVKQMGRGEALRAAQLEMLARNRAEHGDALPATWGAFVLSREWR
ncbi:MAG: CHAT domain-containing protein [Planctomycetes bacterium]|nr:CHAT domain-containing protein [Planctomycetota bacterium]